MNEHYDSARHGPVVSGCGNRSARVVILGEAPGENEIKEGRPFVGRSGELLDKLLGDAGIKRQDCYITNVVKSRPPANEFKWFRKKENRKYLEASIDEVKQEIKEINPNVVIALGNEACAVGLGDRRITARRGFVGWSDELGCKVVATFHPAAVLRGINLYPIALFDIRKAANEARTKEYNYTKREIVLGTSISLVRERLSSLASGKFDRVSFDIETTAEGIDSIAFSWSATEGMSIPFLTNQGSFWSEEAETEIWGYVKSILESDSIHKIAQNGFYDCWWLQRELGIVVKNLSHDTMLAAGLINSEFKKDLWMLATLYTDQPFWEDKGKDDLNEERWKYNGTDACVTWEIADKQRADLANYGHRGFFDRLTMPLLPHLVGASLKGVRFDSKERDRLLDESTRGKRAKIAELLSVTGEGFNYASYPQLCEYFIKGKGIKPIIDRASKRPTFSDDSLDALARSYPELAEFKLIGEVRKYDSDIKILQVDLGHDGRIRCSYNIAGTETGRLSSSDAPDRTGTNLQNIAPKFRRLFLPDDGCYLVKADLKQAENIMVAYMSGDPFMIRAIEEGGDLHTKIAQLIFNKQEITKQERQLGKKTGHASNYGMRYKRLIEVCWEEENLVLSTKEAKALMESYFSAFPGIRSWHRKIQAELSRGRTLTNPFGRSRHFMGHWGDDLFREAYAFLPQGAIADKVALSIIDLANKTDIRLQVHDEIVFNVPVGELDKTCGMIKSVMESPFKIEGRKVSIPVEIKYGVSWGDTKEWRK